MFDEIEAMLKTLGPPPKMVDLSTRYRHYRIVLPDDVAECQMCHRPIKILRQKYFNTDKVTGAYDVLCAECQREFAGTARLICVVCRQVVSRMKPVQFKNGFCIKPGGNYHTDKCAVCTPGLDRSILLEAAAYDAVNKGAK